MFDIDGQRPVGRKGLQKKVLLYEAIGFTAIIGLVWLNETLDIPHLTLGSPQTKVNLREALLESISVLILGIIVLKLTWNFLARIKYLEGFIVVCSFCRKVRIAEDTWASLEEFVHSNAEVEFSHSFCPTCGKEHYADFLKT
jgi:DNA-directed RNA polymerase beta' subunit